MRPKFTQFPRTMKAKAYMMVGAPGSGKSTYIANVLKPQHSDLVIVSGDDIRAELYGDADIQGNYAQIQDRMLEILEENVGKTVVLDGTHYRASYRREALTMLAMFGYSDVTAVVIDRPLKDCFRQNLQRDRHVPTRVIEKMHSSLQASVRGIHQEGFSEVVTVS